MRRLLPLLALALALPAMAQERDSTMPRISPNASVSQTLGLTEVTILYSRPSVRGREIFGGLVPLGEVWRTGANEATAITFSTDVLVEGRPLAAGTYALFTLPDEGRWAVIFNQAPGQWGAFGYDESHDVLRVEVEPEAAPFTETMAFTFEDFAQEDGRDRMAAALRWAETRVPITIEAATDEIVRERAAQAMASGGWEAPYRYAAYALHENRQLEDALGWTEASIAAEERFENVALRARLLAARGETAEAVSAAERALELGEATSPPPAALDGLRQDLEAWRQKR